MWRMHFCVDAIVMIMYKNILPILIFSFFIFSQFQIWVLKRETDSFVVVVFREIFLSWRCIQLKPWWRAFSNHLISDLIHIAMELLIILTIVMVHLYHQAWPCRRWHLLDCHMDSMRLAFHIKVCGVNIVSIFSGLQNIIIIIIIIESHFFLETIQRNSSIINPNDMISYIFLFFSLLLIVRLLWEEREVEIPMPYSIKSNQLWKWNSYMRERWKTKDFMLTIVWMNFNC